ncbi:hypothetical protein [Natronorubrum texcoconense]|uniref:Uncharacterized protein n=1 Tax=Natronorubrum texcoconense TaxID=1095776 RepID=A0A1G9G2K2_9EURY|nr:hypothetical protein [Natronorubrum texcoconense]SDK94888.1 hypothetical protein SAMN04515672_4393 [Natronorubrum texcoconense]
MARDYPVRDPGDPETSDSNTEQSTWSERGTIDRRSYLKLASATAIAAGAASGVAGASSDEYETITARGQVIRIGSGETWENKLIDLGNGNSINIVAQGTDWTIRNIGITGTFHHNTHDYLFSLADTGGNTSTLENVYAGEGNPRASSNERGGVVWVAPDHSGRLEVTNVNFSIAGALGIYGSAPGSNSNGRGGEIHLRNCYGNDCHHTAFRIPDNGSSVRNCVSYKSGNRTASRSAWVWEGRFGGSATFEDCHFITNGRGVGLATNGNPNLSLSNLRTDDGSGDAGNPQHFVPEGCPESAEEAASGGRSDDGDSTPPVEDLPENTLTVIGEGEPTRYYFETTGEITGNPERGDLQEHDEIDGTSAVGWVTTPDHVDGFCFDGDLVDVGFHEGAARIEVNGDVIDPDDYSDDGDEEDETGPDHTLTVIGEGEPTRYYFETSGDIEPNPERGDLQEHDEIDGTSAVGWVTTPENVDGFQFEGELLEVGFHEGAARVELDGEEIDPDDYSGEPDLENLLLVDGVGTSGGTRYEFSVSGEVEKSNERSATIDDEDVIDSGTVTGTVAGWRDAFRFSGDLENLTVDGPARVFVNDDRVDPSEYGAEKPHVLTIVGNRSPASYEVSVDGAIGRMPGDDSTESTTISESTLEGSIERGVQRFRFSGAVSDITFIDGSAHVYVDEERVDPAEVGDAELLPHAVVIDGTDADGETTYFFEVDGDVIASNYRDASVDEGDAIEGTSVTGSVDDSLDAYWFDGEIVDFRVTGDATVDVEYNVRSR